MSPRLQPLVPYIVAIAATTVAWLLTIWLYPFMVHTIAAFFFIAIALSGWYSGTRPVLVSLSLSLIALYSLIQSPISLVIFAIVASGIGLITVNLRASKQHLEHLTQQMQQENNDLLKTALNAAQMGLWDWDMVTGKIHWSPEHEILFGLPVGSFDGRYATFEAYLYPDDLPALNHAIEYAITAHAPYHNEFRVVWPDGSIHWLEGRGNAFYDQAGSPIRMSGTIMAIDDRKQAQEQLTQQYEQQRLVAEVTQRIRRSLDLQDILQTMVNEVRQMLQTDRVILFQLSPEWRGTVIVESVGGEWTPILSTEIYDPCFQTEYVELFKHGLVTAKADIYAAGIAPCHLALLANFQVRANLVIPILKDEQLWGLLIAHHCEMPRHWQLAEINLLKQIATQLSIALQQSALLEQLKIELNERKQAELALQESEERLRLFIRYAPASIIMFDRQMRCLSASQQWLEEVQLSASHATVRDTTSDPSVAQSIIPTVDPTSEASVDQLIGRSHHEIFTNLPEKLKQRYKRGLAGFIEKCDEDMIVYPDGTQQWFRWELHPWYRPNGEIGGIITFSENITQRKQAEIALQHLNAELEQRVTERTAELTTVNARLMDTLIEQQHSQLLLLEQAQLLELAHDTILTCDLNSIITFWNQGAERMYGWSKTAALGQNVHTFLYTQFPQSLADIRAILFVQGYWEGELVHSSQSGQLLTVASRWVLQKDELDRPIKILMINNDITARKQAELALQQYAAEVEDLYNNAPCGYHSLDAYGTIVRINDTELRWFGYSREEIVFKKPLMDLVAADSQPIFAQSFQRLKQSGWIDNVELEMVNRDGSSRWVTISATAIRDESGHFVMSRSTLFDISERRKIDQMKKDFISVVSHELRTPLTSIRGSLGLVAAGVYDKKPEKMRDMIEIAARQSDRLVRLVNDILDLRRLESGQTQFNFKPYAAIDLIQQSVDGMRSQAEANHITLSILRSNVEVWVDADAIVQTLTNLISNAIKFSPPGSTVWLQAVERESLGESASEGLDEQVGEQVDQREGELQSSATTSAPLPIHPSTHVSTHLPTHHSSLATSPHPTVLFSVRDGGRGIPADQLERIFGQFQQVDASDSREKGGTGLGLAICRTIIEHHQGRIWVESALGEGSTFYFTVPAYLPPQ